MSILPQEGAQNTAQNANAGQLSTPSPQAFARLGMLCGRTLRLDHAVNEPSVNGGNH